MQIEISAKNMELLPSLTEYVEEKLGALDKHLQRFELEGEIHAKIRIGRLTAHHQKGEVFEASADLILPGTNLRADKTHEELHAAIDAVRDTLALEIEKYKAKHS